MLIGEGMKTIVLVSCVSKKQSISLPAEDLYISEWFHKAALYARLIGDKWFILSAKYGLLHPDQIIEPYNVTLKSISKYQRVIWARRVLQDLNPLLSKDDSVVILAGHIYREYLEEPLRQMGCQISIPMQGLRIGEQMQWMNKQIKGNR